MCTLRWFQCRVVPVRTMTQWLTAASAVLQGPARSTRRGPSASEQRVGGLKRRRQTLVRNVEVIFVCAVVPRSKFYDRFVVCDGEVEIETNLTLQTWLSLPWRRSPELF